MDLDWTAIITSLGETKYIRIGLVTLVILQEAEFR